MEKKQFEYLNYLYKVLKKRDTEILEHFCDENISDNDYFSYGIQNDIISNTLNVIISYLSGNISSTGVDNSCRTIIEAMTILNIDKAGKISEKQKTIYRYLYSYVDTDNFHSLLKDSDGKLNDKVMKKVLDDKEKAKTAIMEYFNCSPEDLNNRNIGIDDPCFYLKHNLKDKIRFADLVEKYQSGNMNFLKMYEVFSIFIHPRCEMDHKTEKIIMLIRTIFIDNIIDFVHKYLKSSSLLITKKELDNITDFNKDFFYNQIISNNVFNIKNIDLAFDIITNQTCILANGFDYFSCQFLDKIKHIIIDMMTSEALGFKEHVIVTFKSFVEEYAVFYAIGSISDLKDFNCVKQAFEYSSRMQFEKYFNMLNIKDTVIPSEDIKKLYNNYYKDKYNLTSYDKFYKELTKNSLYFLTKERKSYNKLARKLIEDVFRGNELESKDVMTLYRISKDMGHASGYSFNATEGIIDSYCHKSLLYSFKLLKFYLLNASLTLNAHDEKCDLSLVIKNIDILIELESEKLKEIYEIYKINVLSHNKY